MHYEMLGALVHLLVAGVEASVKERAPRAIVAYLFCPINLTPDR